MIADKLTHDEQRRIAALEHAVNYAAPAKGPAGPGFAQLVHPSLVIETARAFERYIAGEQ